MEATAPATLAFTGRRASRTHRNLTSGAPRSTTSARRASERLLVGEQADALELQDWPLSRRPGRKPRLVDDWYHGHGDLACPASLRRRTASVMITVFVAGVSGCGRRRSKGSPRFAGNVAVADVAEAAAVTEDVECADIARFVFPRGIGTRVSVVEEDACLVGGAGVVDPEELQVGTRESSPPGPGAGARRSGTAPRSWLRPAYVACGRRVVVAHAHC